MQEEQALPSTFHTGAPPCYPEEVEKKASDGLGSSVLGWISVFQQDFSKKTQPEDGNWWLSAVSGLQKSKGLSSYAAGLVLEKHTDGNRSVDLSCHATLNRQSKNKQKISLLHEHTSSKTS
jgi:hypothetical protein